jgi:tetratricopeptide (TPR) repeat protein
MTCLLVFLLMTPALLAQSDNSLGSYPAVYDELQVESRFTAMGALEELRTARVRFHSSAGASVFGRVLVPRPTDRSEVEIRMVRVVHEDGSQQDLNTSQLKVETDESGRFQVFVVPGLTVRDKLIYVAFVRTPGPKQPGPLLWSGAPYIDLPVRSGNWVVTTPEGIGAEILRPENYRRTVRGSHAWSLANYRPQPSATGDRLWLSLSSLIDWAAASDWLSSACFLDAPPDADVQAESKRLLRDKRNLDAQLRAVHEFMARSIELRRTGQYLDFETVQSPGETLRRRQGNGLEKNLLAVALLRTAGLRAGIAFSSSVASWDREIPNPMMFNQVLVVVEHDKVKEWIDMANPHFPFRALPPSRRGRRVLLAGLGVAAIDSVPSTSPAPSSVQASWTGTLYEGGTVRGGLKLEIQGDVETLWREALASGAPDAAEEAFKDLVVPSLARRISQCKHSSPSDTQRPLSIECSIAEPEFVKTIKTRSAQLLRVLRFIPYPVPASKQPLRTREEYELGMTEMFDLAVPPSIRVEPLPSVKLGLAGTGTKYESDVRFEQGRLKVRRSLIFDQTVVVADKRSKGQFYYSVLSNNVRPFEFERTTAIDVQSLLKSRSSDDLVRDGHKALNSGDAEHARILWEEAVRKEPKSRWGWNNLGRAYSALGRSSEAITAFQKQLEVHPKDEYSYGNLGRELHKLGRYSEALVAFTEQSEIAPDDPYHAQNLARAFIDTKQWDKALLLLQRVPAQSSKSLSHQVLMAQALGCSGRTSEAKAVIEEMTRSRADAITKNSGAYVFAECGIELDMAFQLVNEALSQAQAQIPPIDKGMDLKQAFGTQIILSALLDTKAWVLFKRGRFDEAATAMEASMSLVVNRTRLVHLRDIKTGQGKLEEAAIAHRAAEELGGGLKLEAPEHIGTVASQAGFSTDANGWTRILPNGALAIPGGTLSTPATVYLACFVSADGSVADTLRLEGTAPWVDAAKEDALKIRFGSVLIGERPLSAVRLLRFVYHPDGHAEVAHTVSEQAVIKLSSLSPIVMPEEMLPEPED